MPVKIVEIVLDEATNTKILIETTEKASPQASGMGVAGIGDVANQVVAAADATFAGAMGIISYSSNVLLAEMAKIDKKPDTAQIEFGLKINAQGKAMLASGGVEANYKVTLSWK